MARAQIDNTTVISALHALNRRYGRWPTVDEIADYLEVDVAVVKPLLRSLRAQRLFRNRTRRGRSIWLPWELS